MALLNKLKGYLLTLGIGGLFFIAFLDSAAVPMAGGPDAFVLFLSWQQPSHLPLIVLAASVGSTLGCGVLYSIARAGGEVALSRFTPEKRHWAKERINRNAFWTVMLSVLAPPPFPTKLIILAAGAFSVRMRSFVVGVFTGRLFRYSVEAYLGARFGDRAAGILKSQYPVIAVVLIGAIILFVFSRRFVRKLGRGQGDKVTR